MKKSAWQERGGEPVIAQKHVYKRIYIYIYVYICAHKQTKQIDINKCLYVNGKQQQIYVHICMCICIYRKRQRYILVCYFRRAVWAQQRIT